LSDELVLDNQDSQVVPCVKVFTISNYDSVVALDIKPKTRYSLEWKPDREANRAHFMAADCSTRCRNPTVYEVFRRPLSTKHV
jgi:hypothetical protein